MNSTGAVRGFADIVGIAADRSQYRGRSAAPANAGNSKSTWPVTSHIPFLKALRNLADAAYEFSLNMSTTVL